MDKWVIRYWKTGQPAKYHTGLSETSAAIWRGRYNNQGYDVVVVMRDHR